ncbi:MAG: glycerol-3-phosphate 1-O-acyltransferase PlsY [Candidatus Aminicenantes bacterium]|nr:glycerol-3-phosphate 1-O-acyltransferase PlsY [Candidatus Aminicenantes bacterium]
MRILFVFFSYLFGSIPTGYLLYQRIKKKDIRQFGSKSMGATNLLRLTDKKTALIAAFVDVLKGFVPVFLSLKLFDDLLFSLLCGFLAVLGHCFPLYIKFKGGKGVATTVGVYLALSLSSLLVLAVVFAAVIAITKYVSLGSLVSLMSLPLTALISGAEIELVYFGVLIFALIAFQHRENIKRLIQGQERKLGEKEA